MQESGIDLLTLRAVDPGKYALQLMDVLFSETEMAKSCYQSSKRTTKPALDSAKINLLEGNIFRYTRMQECVKKVFKLDENNFQKEAAVFRRKCMQNCIDKGRVTVKKEE